MDFEAKNIGAAGNVKIGTQINQFSDKKDLPNTIPLAVGFVGREDYLNDLRESYSNGIRCFVLYGIGGVGKSSLALQFASEIAKDFEARIFIEMQGMSRNPYLWRDAMFEIVRKFNPQVSSKVSDAELKADYIQVLQNQSTLIILDNAKNEIEIAPLISRAKACFIISSRNEIQTTSGITKRLKAMSPNEAEALLFSITPSEKFEGKAKELAKLAGYLPMALKPLAKLLKKRFKTILGIIEEYKQKRLEITDTEYDNLSVEASLALSYDALSDDLKGYWRQLAVFPNDFEVKAASTVFGINFNEGQYILEKLYEDSLIEENTESTKDQTRFYLHDLAQLFADKQLSDDERFVAQFRHAFFYSLIIRQANDLEKQNTKNGYVDSLNIIDSEWENIIVGQNWCSIFWNDDNDIAEICMEYIGIIPDLLSLRLTPRKEIIWCEKALLCARKLRNRQAECFFMGHIGKAKANLGEFTDAIEILEQTLEMCDEIDDIRNEASCLSTLAGIYTHQNNNRKAANLTRRALKIFEFINDAKGICASLNNLGNIFLNTDSFFANTKGQVRKKYRSRWWYKTAFAYFKSAMEIADEINHLIVSGGSRSNIGRMLLANKEFELAKEYLEQALNIHRAIGNFHGVAIGATNLGAAYMELNKKQEACELWKEALGIFNSRESPELNIVQQYINDFC